MDYVIVIPARWQSSRFPGKPLADLNGKPVLVHVWERCVRVADPDRVIVATDDKRIGSVMDEVGARTQMTSTHCLTGTDRVAEVAVSVIADWYVNVQGDEPFVETAAISAVVQAARLAKDSTTAINAMTRIRAEPDFRSSTIPKVVCDSSGSLLYISRASIPTDKALGFRSAFRQVGLYAYRRDALKAFSSQEVKTALEEIEDIEILRLLELGHQIQMIEVVNEGPAVDTPEDLERAKAYLANQVLE